MATKSNNSSNWTEKDLPNHIHHKSKTFSFKSKENLSSFIAEILSVDDGEEIHSVHINAVEIVADLSVLIHIEGPADNVSANISLKFSNIIDRLYYNHNNDKKHRFW